MVQANINDNYCALGLKGIKMSTARKQEQDLIKKIRMFAPERLAEVDDFVDFLRQRINDRGLIRSASKLPESTFSKVWDNPEDAAYDNL